MSYAQVIQPFADLITCASPSGARNACYTAAGEVLAADGFVAGALNEVECLVGLHAAELKCVVAAASASTIVASGFIALGLGVLCYLLSQLTGNDSWVDRLWSVVPPGFMWYYVYATKDPVFIEAAGVKLPTAYGGFAIVGTIWGIRLTYNFWRRGGYQPGGEDYRWEHVRTWPAFKNRVVWQLFSFSFISVFQQLLLWAITLPVLSRKPGKAATSLDLAVMTGMLFFILGETIADQQQWNFQNEKRNNDGFTRRPALAGDYKRGFLTHGLFSRSRHPNVWCEQQIWITLYGLTLLSFGAFNWYGLGCLILVILTVRSSALTESLSVEKYPSYRAYRKVVPMLVPGIFSFGRAKIDAALDKVEKAN